MKYIALLRGINVGGNNKVPMSELRACFEAAGFKNVSTYINSGKVLFDTSETDKVKLVQMCELAIETMAGFHVVCSVITVDELRRAIDNAPSWWGVSGADSKNNAIFVIPPTTVEAVMAGVGEAKPEYEKVQPYESIIFWTAPIETFNRTRYKSIIGSAVYRQVTIRNAATTKKLLELSSSR